MNAQGVDMHAVSYDIAAPNGRGDAYKPSYGTLLGGMDFYGATQTDGLMCGNWEDIQSNEQTLTPEKGVKRMSFADRAARFMKYFNEAYIGNLPETEDPEKVHTEMEREEAVTEGALAERLRVPGKYSADDEKDTLFYLMMSELARIIRGGPK